MDIQEDKSSGWLAFSKAAHADLYTRNGGMYGAISGAALAAIISALKYGKGKKHKNGSVFNRIMKGLLWTGAGALGGGVLGAGIGRMIGSHVEYSRALKRAKEIVEERRKNGQYDRRGRVLLLNYPDNKMIIGDKELEKGLPNWVGEKPRAWLKKLFPRGLTIQHGAVITMDEDGGDARMFEVGDVPASWSNTLYKNKVQQGKNEGDEEKIRGGNYGLEQGNTWAELSETYLGDSLKGKTNQEIADMFAEYGLSDGEGGRARIYEGKKGVDLNLVHAFLESYHDAANGYGGTGYTIIPGGYNCGTSARAAFDSVQSPWSHYLDMLCGGFPSNNMPFLATEAKSIKVPVKKKDDDTDIQDYWTYRRRKGDEFLY